jgi:hypothetical protein
MVSELSLLLVWLRARSTQATVSLHPQTIQNPQSARLRGVISVTLG